MTTEALLSLLQFTDGLFPAGAYAHSFGLESYVQAGTVQDAAGVEAFLRALLEGSSGPTDAVIVLWAWRADDLATCLRIDRTFDAMKAASELRNASRQMGRQVLRVASSLADRARQGRLVADLLQAAERGLTPGHHPVAFGVAGSILGWPPEATAGAYLYSTGAAVVAAALRLLPLGQLAGQHLLANVRPLCVRLAKQAQATEPEQIWSFAPALEIAAMRHARLEARLFRS